MVWPMVLVAVILLVAYLLLDLYLYREEAAPLPGSKDEGRLGLEGKINILVLAGVVGAVLLSGVWESGIDIIVYHVEVTLQSLNRGVLLVAWRPRRWC
jgi:Na+/H+ antiporter NhaD/arsenite permease-like protein